ncbi:MAG: M23 family metallopeptidase [Ignavibacteria bacterium]|nr:M23 family metallopeptidase [Ignavibacteria bacterium]
MRNRGSIRGIVAAATGIVLLSSLFHLLTATQSVQPEPESSEIAESVPETTDFDDYIWPTDAGPVITSTFAEYRRAHFHGGIDISTGNDTGFLVYASRDGYVSRIIVSPDGYGKMLYVRHPDRFSTTYAHLRNFAPELDERVRLEQEKTGAYPVSIHCGPGEFPVRKGDVIAFTGETGVGSPHLHFEIRDPQNDFVNPLQCTGFPNIDSVPPTVRRLAVRPIGDQSQVDGSWKTRTYSVRRSGNNTYAVGEPIRITGSAGFAIDARDKSEQTYYRQGVHSLTLLMDDQPFYSVHLNSAPSSNSHQSGLYYDWELADAGLGRFQRLFTAPYPNSLQFYTPRRDSSGVISLAQFPAGEHRFVIQVVDRGGNRCEVTGMFIIHDFPVITAERVDQSLNISFAHENGMKSAHISTRSGSTGKWSTSVKPVAEFRNPLVISTDGLDMVKVVTEDEWGGKSLPHLYDVGTSGKAAGAMTVEHQVLDGFVRIDIRTGGATGLVPQLKVYEGTMDRVISVKPVDTDRFAGTFVPNDTIGGIRRAVATIGKGKTVVTAFDEFELYPMIPGRAGTYFADEGNLILSYDSSSVLSPLFLEVVRGDFRGERTWLLEPVNTVLNKGIVVSMRADSIGGNAGLMVHTRTGWKLLARQSSLRNSYLTGRIRQMLGEIGIIRDDVPPILTGLRIRQRRQAFPEISFRFDDGFSGIEYEELKMYIDDTLVIPEIDGEHNRAVYHPSKPLGNGTHHLTIRAMDRLGNSKELRKQFTVR